MIDHLGNKIKLNKLPQRIVSLVPSQTELVADLGMKNQLVGVTKFCVHPQNIRKQAKVVGGTKSVHFEKIRGLDPDLILCNKEENTAEIVSELQKIASVHVSDVVEFSDAYRLILDYGMIFQKEQRANQLVADIKLQFKELQLKQKKKISVGYFIWKDPWMVAANDTFIHHLIEELGLRNAFENQTRYPEVNINDLPFMDWVLLSSEPYPFKAEHFSAFTDKRIKLEIVDGECFSWYGSRLFKSIAYFQNLLHKMTLY